MHESRGHNDANPSEVSLANDAPQPPLGLACRHCGCGHFWTLETRKIAGGRVMRRRECRHCGRRMTTYEKAFG